MGVGNEDTGVRADRDLADRRRAQAAAPAHLRYRGWLRRRVGAASRRPSRVRLAPRKGQRSVSDVGGWPGRRAGAARDATEKQPVGFSPDGKYLFYSVPTGAGHGRLWLLPLADRKPREFLPGTPDQSHGRDFAGRPLGRLRLGCRRYRPPCLRGIVPGWIGKARDLAGRRRVASLASRRQGTVLHERRQADGGADRHDGRDHRPRSSTGTLRRFRSRAPARVADRPSVFRSTASNSSLARGTPTPRRRRSRSSSTGPRP